jgi:hypothetical protein
MPGGVGRHQQQMQVLPAEGHPQKASLLQLTNHRAPMRCLHQSGPDACSQLQGLREEGPSSAHPDEGTVGPTPPWTRARAKQRSAGLARSQRAQSPQAAAGRHRELHRCGLRDGRGGAAAKLTAQSGEHRSTKPRRANKPRGPAQSPYLDERELPGCLRERKRKPASSRRACEGV